MSTINGWNNNVSDPKNDITLNAGTNTINIGSDASANSINLGTGAAAKVVTVGSTNGASSLALKTGTADFSLASATGNIIVALDTGQVTKPLQPAFMACLSATRPNVSGTAGAWININANTEIFDVGNNYDNGTFTFTAPVTGKYFLGLASAFTTCTVAKFIGLRIVTSNRNYAVSVYRNPSSDNMGLSYSSLADMDAGDTATFYAIAGGEAADTDDMYGDGTPEGGTYCYGYLVC